MRNAPLTRLLSLVAVVFLTFKTVQAADVTSADTIRTEIIRLSIEEDQAQKLTDAFPDRFQCDLASSSYVVVIERASQNSVYTAQVQMRLYNSNDELRCGTTNAEINGMTGKLLCHKHGSWDHGFNVFIAEDSKKANHALVYEMNFFGPNLRATLDCRL